MSLVTVCMYVSATCVHCKISLISTNDNILIEKSCSTFVGELYHTCGRVISHLWADYKTLVGVCISSEFTSRAVSLMCVITMTNIYI